MGKVLGRGIFVIDGKLYDSWDQPAAEIGDLKTATHLPGAHNWQNAALAYAALRRLLRDPRAIMQAITRFPGLAHRIEEVGRIGRTRFINDSKATNADAAARARWPAIPTFSGSRAASPRRAASPIWNLISRGCAKPYLIGEAAEAFGRTLAGKVEVMQAGTLERALHAAYEDAQMSDAPEPVVLLSPACASFDQFRDFEHRGDMFREMVKTMTESQTPAVRSAGTA